MRLISGSAGGRRLDVPSTSMIRPTPDRVREALFSILADRCEGARVLDACAGTGALGLEALSRGAESALFVEKHPRTAAVLRETIARLGLAGGEVVQSDVLRAAARLAAEGVAFDLIFVDPPYRLELWEPILRVLVEGGLLAKGAVVVVEHPTDAEPRCEGMLVTERRRYGNVVLSFFESG